MHHDQQFLDEAHEQLVSALNNLCIHHNVSYKNPFVKQAIYFSYNLKCRSECPADSYGLHDSLFDMLDCYDNLNCSNKYFNLCEDARDRLTNSGKHHESLKIMKEPHER